MWLLHLCLPFETLLTAKHKNRQDHRQAGKQKLNPKALLFKETID